MDTHNAWYILSTTGTEGDTEYDAHVDTPSKRGRPSVLSDLQQSAHSAGQQAYIIRRRVWGIIMLRALWERALDLVREVNDGKEGRADGEDGGGSDPFFGDRPFVLCAAA